MCCDFLQYTSIILVCARPSLLDPCDDDPCGRHGSCRDLGNNDYRCSCDDGYTGDRCENRFGKCSLH